MARNFIRSNSDHLEGLGTPGLSTPPYTLSGWFNSVSIIASQIIFAYSESASAPFIALAARGDKAGDPVQFMARGTNDIFNNVVSSSAYSTGQNHHVAGRMFSTSNMAVFHDGVKTEKAGINFDTISTSDTTSVGRLVTGGSATNEHMDGDVWEVAAWNVDLTDDEILLLSKGFSPLMLTHRIKDLVFYKDLIRDINRPGIGVTLINTGSTVSPHSAIYYPASPYIIPVPPSAPASLAVSLPPFRNCMQPFLVR